MNDLLVPIITALITGGITLIGVVLSNNTKQAVIEERLSALKTSVDKHNGFAERMPVVEEQIKVINHRIDDLEEEMKK